jgi:tyrosine-protein phosphatase YwqE
LKHLIHLLLFVFGYSAISQEKIAISDKAFHLHNKLESTHVIASSVADSLGSRYTSILLGLLDSKRIIFTNSDRLKLTALGRNIQEDFTYKKTRFYSEVSAIFQKRILELETEQKKLNEIPLNLTWKESLSQQELASFPEEANRMNKLKKLFLCRLFQ